MKKIFSLFAAVLFAGSMMAETITLTAEDYAATSFSASGISVATAKNNGSTEPAYNATGKDIRVYAKGSITISADQNITGISFVISTQGKKRLAPLTVDAGEVVVTGDPDFTAVWSGSANEVTFTVGDKADYGTDGNSKAGQLDFTAIEVTVDGEAVVLPNYYLIGSMNGWYVGDAAYKFKANPSAEGEYMLQNVVLAADVELKAIGVLNEETTWYPDAAENLHVYDAGVYDIYFRPNADGGDDWYEHVLYLAKIGEVPTSCAAAAEAILALESNGYLFGGAEFTLRGYVTEIDTEYSDTFHNISFWMADVENGENTLMAYRAACASAEDAPAVGDAVEVTGKLKKYNTTAEFDTNCTFTILSEGITTGMSNAAAEVKAVKMIENGQLIIIKNGVRFNALGAQMR